jgi:hypothetical protein
LCPVDLAILENQKCVEEAFLVAGKPGEIHGDSGFLVMNVYS